MTPEEKVDKALHVDWAFAGKARPTRIIIDGSPSKGAYYTSYDIFVQNILTLIKEETIKELNWAKGASVWNIEHRIAELKDKLGE